MRVFLETSEELDQTDDGEAPCIVYKRLGEKAECTRSLSLPDPAF